MVDEVMATEGPAKLLIITDVEAVQTPQEIVTVYVLAGKWEAVWVVCPVGNVLHKYIQPWVHASDGVAVAVPLACPQFSSVLVAVTVNGATVTVTEVSLIHPFASVPVTVYIDVVIGSATTFAPVVGASPAKGLHE